MIKHSKTPGNHNLFEANDNAEQLDRIKANTFHKIVANLLFVSKRARLGINLIISFLCARVTKSDTDDLEKMKTLIGYLKSTIDLPMILSTSKLRILKTWTVASYAVHNDYRGYEGGVYSVGEGIVCTTSSKQKLNAKSSTESEIIGASDSIMHIMDGTIYGKAGIPNKN